MKLPLRKEACIIGEPPYIKPFDAAHQLNGENDGEVSDCKRYHGRKGLIPLHDTISIFFGQDWRGLADCRG